MGDPYWDYKAVEHIKNPVERKGAFLALRGNVKERKSTGLWFIFFLLLFVLTPALMKLL